MSLSDLAFHIMLALGNGPSHGYAIGKDVEEQSGGRLDPTTGALYQVLQGNTAFAELAVRSPEQGWYALLGMFPGAMFLIGLATLSGLLFYLTSANSGAMVMSNFSASIPDPSQGGPKWLRIFWAVLNCNEFILQH